MPFIYPDNPHRENRVRELATTVQNDLFEARQDFEEFQRLCKTADSKIAQAYQEAGLTAPKAELYEVVELGGATDDSTGSNVVLVSKIILDVVGTAFAFKFLIPGATQLLVDVGVMSAETAATVLVKLPVQVLGEEVTITAGGVAAGVLVGALSGVAIAGIDLGISAIEGKIVKDKLQNAIHGLYPMRLATRVTLNRARELLRSMRSVTDAMDAISGDPEHPPTEKQIQNIITKVVTPAVEADKKITPDTVAAELADADRVNHSWTHEDK
jgi:hypothetical protein